MAATWKHICCTTAGKLAFLKYFPYSHNNQIISLGYHCEIAYTCPKASDPAALTTGNRLKTGVEFCLRNESWNMKCQEHLKDEHFIFMKGTPKCQEKWWHMNQIALVSDVSVVWTKRTQRAVIAITYMYCHVTCLWLLFISQNKGCAKEVVKLISRGSSEDDWQTYRQRTNIAEKSQISH